MNLPDSRLAREQPTQLSTRALSILVADDNYVNQELAKAQFEMLGYDVDVARDGTEVLAALRDKTYDIVFMDVHMPKLNGLETTRRIREQTSDGAPPRIIGMTADASEQQRKRCLQAGMDECIEKPVELEQLEVLLSACSTRAQT